MSAVSRPPGMPRSLANADSPCPTSWPLSQPGPPLGGSVGQPSPAGSPQLLGTALQSHPRLAGVQRASRLAQQRAIGRVLHQGVLEEVHGVRRRPLARQQPRLKEPVQRRLFGQIKQARGFRQFLLRGVEKVANEWGLVKAPVCLILGEMGFEPLKPVGEPDAANSRIRFDVRLGGSFAAIVRCTVSEVAKLSRLRVRPGTGSAPGRASRYCGRGRYAPSRRPVAGDRAARHAEQAPNLPIRWTSTFRGWLGSTRVGPQTMSRSVAPRRRQAGR